MPIVAGRLSVAIVLAPNFTMLAFAAFVDTLRLSADQGDGSRPIVCSWTVLSHDMRPVRSSCGVAVVPTAELDDPCAYDFVVVVGGLLKASAPAAPLLGYLQRAAAMQVPLVGLCTGSFILARAGLMQNRRCCVSWFHHEEFVTEFPAIAVDSDVLYVVDGDRLTCAGGTSVVLLASYLIDSHCGRGNAAKARRIMLEDAAVPVLAPLQPQPPNTHKTHDVRLRKVMSLLERNIDKPLSIEFTARHVGLSARQLERLFVRDLGTSPSEFAISLRLSQGQRLVAGSRDAISDIALQCGFTSSAHFARRFRAAFGHSPIEWRQHCASKKPQSLSA